MNGDSGGDIDRRLPRAIADDAAEGRMHMIDFPAMTRRTAMAGVATAISAPALAIGQSTAPAIADVRHRFPEATPGLELVMQILVEVADPIDLGAGPDGARRMVPILGGRFEGRGVSGIVLPGGADRQRVRANGVRQLDALYELKADDGTIMTVRNAVLVDDSVARNGVGRYARSVVTVTAPDGPHAWLNRSIIVGTLTSLRPTQPFVFVRLYRVT